jgi:peroxiredoxin family protein
MTTNATVMASEKQTAEDQRRPKGVTMVVFSGDLDKLLAAFIIANGAAAMDVPVTMFFTFWGLNVLRRDGPVQIAGEKSFVEKMFGRMMPRGPNKMMLSKMNMGGLGTMFMKREMKKKNVYSLQELVKQAQEQGIKFIACTMTMDLMGIKKEELIPDIDFAGVATFVDVAKSGHSTLFIS